VPASLAHCVAHQGAHIAPISQSRNDDSSKYRKKYRNTGKKNLIHRGRLTNNTTILQRQNTVTLSLDFLASEVNMLHFSSVSFSDEVSMFSQALFERKNAIKIIVSKIFPISRENTALSTHFSRRSYSVVFVGNRTSSGPWSGDS